MTESSPKTPRVSHDARSSAPIHIVGCDDDPAAHDWLIQVPKSKRDAIQYTPCASVAELIRILNAPGADVDVVVLDLNLGSTNGIDTFNALQADVDHLPPVIIRSGEDEDKMRPLLVGANKAFHYLSKEHSTGPMILSLARDLIANEHRFYRYVAPPPEEEEARARIEAAKRAAESLPPGKADSGEHRLILKSMPFAMQTIIDGQARLETAVRETHENTSENRGHILRLDAKVAVNERDIDLNRTRLTRAERDIDHLDDRIDDTKQSAMQSTHDLDQKLAAQQLARAQDSAIVKKAKLTVFGKIAGGFLAVLAGVLGALNYLKDTKIGHAIAEMFKD